MCIIKTSKGELKEAKRGLNCIDRQIDILEREKSKSLKFSAKKEKVFAKWQCKFSYTMPRRRSYLRFLECA
jgi:hypothetical protein